MYTRRVRKAIYNTDGILKRRVELMKQNDREIALMEEHKLPAPHYRQATG